MSLDPIVVLPIELYDSTFNDEHIDNKSQAICCLVSRIWNSFFQSILNQRKAELFSCFSSIPSFIGYTADEHVKLIRPSILLPFAESGGATRMIDFELSNQGPSVASSYDKVQCHVHYTEFEGDLSNNGLLAITPIPREFKAVALEFDQQSDQKTSKKLPFKEFERFTVRVQWTEVKTDFEERCADDHKDSVLHDPHTEYVYKRTNMELRDITTSNGIFNVGEPEIVVEAAREIRTLSLLLMSYSKIVIKSIAETPSGAMDARKWSTSLLQNAHQY